MVRDLKWWRQGVRESRLDMLERLERVERQQEVAETSAGEWGAADGHRGHCSLSSRSRLELWKNLREVLQPPTRNFCWKHCETSWMFADSSSIYIYSYPPRRPVRDEGVDGGVGDGVLVHGLVVRHALVLEPVSPEDLLRHVGGADLQCSVRSGYIMDTQYYWALYSNTHFQLASAEIQKPLLTFISFLAAIFI